MGKSKISFCSTLVKNRDGEYHCFDVKENIYFNLRDGEKMDEIIARGGEIKVTIEDNNQQKGTNNE